ncbi:hypothetical protein D3C81_1787380 [compost metagenome]
MLESPPGLLIPRLERQLCFIVVSTPILERNRIIRVQIAKSGLDVDLLRSNGAGVKAPMKVTLTDHSLAGLGVVEQLPHSADHTCLPCPVFADEDVQPVVELDGERLAETFKTADV